MQTIWRLALAGTLALGCVSVAAAQDMAGPRLVYLGSDPSEGVTEPVDSGLTILHLPTLPLADGAENDVLAAMLRAAPVSTLAVGPGGLTGSAADVFVVADLAVTAGPDGALRLRVGADDMTPPDFAARIDGVLAALSPRARQIAFIRISDPDGLVPAALEPLRQMIGQAGFALSVVTVGPDAAICGGARPAHHLAILSGVPDRTPFGDDDGQASSAEVRGWMANAIERARRRAEPCAPDYGFLLVAADDPEATLVNVPTRPLVPGIESAVYMETFEAVFLEESNDAAAIGAFLDTCTFCPGEARLSARLRDIADQAVVLELETGVWQQIAADDTPTRITAYLANCRLCAFRAEAEARLASLAAADAAREQEAALRDTLVAARDLAGLRDWLSTCVACEGRDDVVAAVTAIEADTAYQAEQAALDAAIAAQNVGLVQAWLDGCTLCDGRDRAALALADLARQEAALAPCRAAAGLPQTGGPRMLADIDISGADAACAAVLAEFPASPEAQILLGRVALAEGDVAAARAAYDAGVAAAVPAAYGLAAHEAYAPTDGAAPDYAQAEALALQGHAVGDWLSAEVLAVLYSNELIPGRTAADAYAVASQNAAAGNPAALFFQGYFLQNGLGTAPSVAQAVDAYQAAVDAGYLHAASFLAEIYERGADGVSPDALRAADLYWLALTGKDPTALDRLTTQIAARSADVVRAVQERLRDAGYFNGRIDGLAGPNTIEAVRAYVTGQVFVE